MTRKRYFVYHFKKNLFYFLSAAVILIWVVYNTSVNTEYYRLEAFGVPYESIYQKLSLVPAAMCLAFLSAFTPIVELSVFKKRRDLDSLFSLPVSRREMLGVHFLNGLLINSTIFTASILTLLLCATSFDCQYEALFPLLPFWLSGLVLGAALYSLSSFLFYEGNTLVDGIVFIIGSQYIPILFFNAVLFRCFNFETRETFEFLTGLSPWNAADFLATYFEKMILPPNESYLNNTSGYISIGFFVLVGIASLFGFFHFSYKKRVEKTGEISESFFGYRVQLPLILLSLLLITCGTLTLVFLSMISVFIGYLIYRRGFHFKREDAIVCGSILLLGFILAVISA